MRKWSDIFLSNPEIYTFEERIFVYANLVSIFTCWVAIISNTLSGIFFTASIFLGIASLGYLMLFFFVKKYHLRLSYFYIYASITMTLLMGLWFQNGGIDSPLIAFFFLAMLLLIILDRTKRYWGVSLLVFCIFLLSLIIEYFYPALVTSYPNKETRFFDVSFSYLNALFFFILLLRVFKQNFDKERITVQQQNQELTQLTEEVHSQNELLEKQNQKLAKANKNRDRLFSIIAHDLRSPIYALQSMINIMEESNLSAEEIKMFTIQINKDLKNTTQLLENLLLWAKSQVEEIKGKEEEINLKLLIESKLSLFYSQLTAKKIILENQIGEGIYVLADANMIGIVIQNLLSNAIKFSYIGGRLIMSMENHGENFIKISISDTGIGISKDKQAKIFDKDTYFSTQGTQGEKGTGLGLLICKEFVQKSGGEIWVKSEEGKGSMFCFTLKNIKS
jgi:signal transduction histidine kinase